MTLPFYSEVLTQQTTSSGTFTDLATVGPSVTFTIDPAWSRDVIVFYNCRLFASSGSTAICNVQLDSSVPANNDGAILSSSVTATYAVSAGTMRVFSDLSEGEHTIKLVYASSGTGTFLNRKLYVAFLSEKPLTPSSSWPG